MFKWQEKYFPLKIFNHILCCHDKLLTNRNQKNMQNILPYFLFSLLTKYCYSDNEPRHLQKISSQSYIFFYLNYYLSSAVCAVSECLSICLSAKKNFLMVAPIKNVTIKSWHIFKKNKNGHFIFGFFWSDPSKMDQTCKFGEQTSRILKFKPEGLEG